MMPLDHGHPIGGVGMGVGFVGHAVRRQRVCRCDAPGQRLSLSPASRLTTCHGAAPLDAAVVLRGDAGRILAPVFQPFQAGTKDRHIALADMRRCRTSRSSFVGFCAARFSAARASGTWASVDLMQGGARHHKASAGTSLVITLPAPTMRRRRTLTGATSAVLEPMKAARPRCRMVLEEPS